MYMSADAIHNKVAVDEQLLKDMILKDMSADKISQVTVDEQLLRAVRNYNIPGYGGMPYEDGVDISASAVFGRVFYCDNLFTSPERKLPGYCGGYPASERLTNIHNNIYSNPDMITKMINEKANGTIRSIIDTNGDGYCSKEEIQAFDKKWDLAGTFNPNIYNLFAYTKKAIIPQTLFADTKYSCDVTCDKSADDIVGKSIITESDFVKLAMAGGKDDSISKETFDKFNFDSNGDGIIDENEYKIGMQKVDEYLSKQGIDDISLESPRKCDRGTDECNMSNNYKEHNNDTAMTAIPNRQETINKSTI